MKKTVLLLSTALLTILLAVCGNAGSIATDSSTSTAESVTTTEKLYYLSIWSNLKSCVLLINGMEWHKSPGSTSGNPREWLVRGENTLELRWDLAEDAASGRKAELELECYWVTQEDAEKRPERTLADFTLTAEAAAAHPTGFVKTFTLPDFPETAFGRALSGPPVVGANGMLEKQDQEAILARIKALVTAYSSGNYETAWEQQMSGNAMYKTPEKTEEQKAIFLEVLNRLDTLTYMEPNGPFILEPVCQGTLIYVKRAENSENTLEFEYTVEGYDGVLALKLYFAKIDGQWVIIQ